MDRPRKEHPQVPRWEEDGLLEFPGSHRWVWYRKQSRLWSSRSEPKRRENYISLEEFVSDLGIG